MDEVIPRRPRPIPLDPCPVVTPCRACGRHTNEWLTWAEVHRLWAGIGRPYVFGSAGPPCLTCLLTDVPRTATMP